MARLTVVTGPPGAGKSTYACQLAAQLGAVLLDMDVLAGPVIEAGLRLAGEHPDDRDSAMYKSSFRMPVYQALFDVALQNVAHLPVVIVGPFSREIQQPDWHEQLAEQFQCDVDVVYMLCALAQRKRRMERRHSARDRAKLADWAGYVATLDAETPPRCDHRVVISDE
ncbi:ATP-binding protein [Aestuariibacter halophilus]|uniref:ATP-binding protein n=1 Tax=Fluctibacter halophilus TaxID=226011 RepID=A0ABS8GAJ1_9ALTE|nr:AAA family ATPase [Aestuariibacter halophilus]MCC2617091.1 ATP-binding protein [Aestuariibacter halophilus]